MFETVDVGILSIIPPIIAIVLALITKEVISALLIGILSGTLIYVVSSGGGGLVEMGTVAFGLIAETVGQPGKFNIILFLGLLGALVYVVTIAGGSRAYGNWAATKLKSRRSAQLATSVLGVIIFVDDYFNCLTVGTVMKPVTDKYQISRAKLAYIIDSTAAPICIIAPISSWAAAVGSTLYETGAFQNELSAFIATIPYNLYALLSILMVIILSVTNLDFGPMARIEKRAIETGELGALDTELEEKILMDGKGTIWDLIIPICSLIAFSILSMLQNGGYWSGEGLSLSEAFGNCDASAALVMGAFWALLVTFLLFVPRKLIDFKTFMGGIGEGIKTMVPAYIILTLAWTIGALCQDLLGTGLFIGELVKTSSIPVGLIPAMIFLVSALLSFSIGTAWGTFGIFIPIVVMISQYTAPELMVVTLSATLAGSVFGDHCSPISDTTILSSTGAGCDHIQHVSTQMLYAVLVAACSFVGYLVAGLSYGNLVLTWVTSVGLLIISLIVFHRISKSKLDQLNFSNLD